MFDSVRVRLTFWYSAVLAGALLLLAGTSYWMIRNSTMARTDADLSELANSFLDTVEAELKEPANARGIVTAAQQSMLEHRYRDHFFVILDPSGSVLTSSRDLPSSSPRSQEDALRVLSSPEFTRFLSGASGVYQSFQTVPGHRDGFRCYTRQFRVQQQAYSLVILRSLHGQEELLERIRVTFAWLIPLALAAAAIGGYFLARKSLAPVVTMGAQAAGISAANLHERLAVHNPGDELGKLATNFNSLLDRLDQSFERQRRFVSDASHELRTPVAILRGESEVALSQPSRAPEEYRESLAILHEEAKRLTRIVEDLFMLTRADSGEYSLTPQDFYLDELVAECVRSVRTLAQAKEIALTVGNSSELKICADEALLRRMLFNLLDNAIKFTPAGGRVAVSCRRKSDELEVGVSDTGPGVPQELQARIFERFFRADPARSRVAQNAGAGLGLAIARWIAEAHHGSLELTRSDSSGSTFAVLLPAADSVDSVSAR